jgi:tripartite ATP-independent transporter DctM subunit
LAKEERFTWLEKLSSLKGVFLPMLLVVSVLGSIFAGVATPTEAAAVGASGAIVSAALHGRISWRALRNTADKTMKTVAMVMWIVFGAGCFTAIYQGLGASGLIEGLLRNWILNKWIVMAIMQFIWLILGCLMDSLSILMITAPVFFPVANLFGFDMLWFGILFTINSEMDLLTPPFGVNLVVMKGIVPSSISMTEIYWSALPFVALQIVCLIVVILIPGFATWLPNLVFQ